MKLLSLIIFTFAVSVTQAQSSISGLLKNDSIAVSNGYVALFSKADTAMIKVEATNALGEFKLDNLLAGNYFLKATYMGLPDLIIDDIKLGTDESLDLETILFKPQALDLDEVVITAQRSLIEVKPDRTIFNVEGTINSTGSNALELLRKAPAVNVDNNDNVSVLGRSGVRIYIDGEKLPLAGTDLSNYLKNINKSIP